MNEGDVIMFEVQGDHLVVRKVTAGRDDHVLVLSKVLNEWVSPADKAAWSDL